MNKPQEALKFLIVASGCAYEECEECSIKKFCHKYEAIQTIQKLINEHENLKEENQKLKDKATPKKLKQTTDKDGRLLWVCPTCGDVYKKFWSVAETVTHRRHCEACGQKLDWS